VVRSSSKSGTPRTDKNFYYYILQRHQPSDSTLEFIETTDTAIRNFYVHALLNENTTLFIFSNTVHKATDVWALNPSRWAEA